MVFRNKLVWFFFVIFCSLGVQANNYYTSCEGIPINLGEFHMSFYSHPSENMPTQTFLKAIYRDGDQLYVPDLKIKMGTVQRFKDRNDGGTVYAVAFELDSQSIELIRSVGTGNTATKEFYTFCTTVQF